MVDLRANPFYLDEESVRWVEETVADMTEHEKICQLFADPLMGMSRQELGDFLERWPLGGIPFRAALFGNEEAQEILTELQEKARIPYLVAGNCESGPNGALPGGTLVASGAQVRASRDVRFAYEVGRITGVETSAVGYNWSFGPVGDILMNWRNSLINTRAYGNDADFVSECVENYNKGCMEYGAVPWSIACGCDMVLGVNDMEEDYEAMKAGIRSGVITRERLQDALYRILGCKAAVGLHRKKAEGGFARKKEELGVIGCKEHQAIAREAAKKAITLVKNTRSQIPLSPQQYKKIGVFVLAGNVGRQRSIYGQGVQSGGSEQSAGYD